MKQICSSSVIRAKTRSRNKALNKLTALQMSLCLSNTMSENDIIITEKVANIKIEQQAIGQPKQEVNVSDCDVISTSPNAHVSIKCEPSELHEIVVKEFEDVIDFENGEGDSEELTEPSTSNTGTLKEIKCVDKLNYEDPTEAIRKEKGEGIHPRYECIKCQKCYSTLSNLRMHIRTMHSSLKPHQCILCSRSFVTNCALISHLHSHTNEKPYMCKICGLAFGHTNTLRLHKIRSHYDGPKEVHKCPDCQKIFFHVINLRNHQVVHSKAKPFHCSQCGQQFKQRYRLKAHVARKHTGDMRFHCDICRKSMSTNWELRCHMDIHQGIRRYQCKVCSKSFSRHGTLKNHLLTHANKQPHECIFCEQTFSHNHILQDHIMIHIGEIHYQCRICQSVLKNRHSYHLHMKLHSDVKPWECNECGKKFSQKHQLKRHNHLRHLNIKTTSVCLFCDRKYSRNVDLYAHITKHIREYWYYCQKCDKACTRKSSLTQHILRCHGRR